MQDFSWSHDEDSEFHISKSTNYRGVYTTEIQTLMTQLLGEKSQGNEEETICIDLFPDSLNNR